MAPAAEDYELALEKDEVKERLLVRRSYKADSSMPRSASKVFLEGSRAAAEQHDEAEVGTELCEMTVCERSD